MLCALYFRIKEDYSAGDLMRFQVEEETFWKLLYEAGFTEAITKPLNRLFSVSS